MNREVGLAFQAWFLGLATLAFVVFPGVVALDGLLTEPFLETLPVRLVGWGVMLVPSLVMTATVGIVLSAPLFLIALLSALTFRRQIKRHPFMFAATAPLVAVGLMIMVTLPDRETWAGVLDRAFAQALRVENWIVVALPVLVGSLWFCLRLRRLDGQAGG
jgi:hypothetical protein